MKWSPALRALTNSGDRAEFTKRPYINKTLQINFLGKPKTNTGTDAQPNKLSRTTRTTPTLWPTQPDIFTWPTAIQSRTTAQSRFPEMHLPGINTVIVFPLPHHSMSDVLEYLADTFTSLCRREEETRATFRRKRGSIFGLKHEIG